MGMRPIDIIAISGKTQDAAQAQAASVRAHGNLQDQLAVQQSARSERASELVAGVTPEDRLELSTQGDGGTAGGGGDSTGSAPDPEGEALILEEGEPALSERHIDFLA